MQLLHISCLAGPILNAIKSWFWFIFDAGCTFVTQLYFFIVNATARSGPRMNICNYNKNKFLDHFW